MRQARLRKLGARRPLVQEARQRPVLVVIDIINVCNKTVIPLLLTKRTFLHGISSKTNKQTILFYYYVCFSIIKSDLS